MVLLMSSWKDYEKKFILAIKELDGFRKNSDLKKKRPLSTFLSAWNTFVLLLPHRQPPV